MQKISILGCGWLGFPLAQALIEKGFSVKGSTTSESKIPRLAASGIKPYPIDISADGVTGDVAGFLESEILIINIPPKKNEGSFADKIRALIPHINESEIRKVLFVSSVSVYGENIGTVTEDAIPNPETDNGKQLLEAENILLQSTGFHTTVLRFGGLIGGDRHPVKFLSGKENDNPEKRINLIHREDCIGIIEKIISLEKWGETYNAVSPFHPTRKEYYTRKAAEMDLPAPFFTDRNDEGKIVCADKIIVDLEFLFEKPFL